MHMQRCTDKHTSGCKVVCRVLYIANEMDGSDGDGRLGNDSNECKEAEALIMKMNILQNNEFDDRERSIGQGMWNMACLV